MTILPPVPEDTLTERAPLSALSFEYQCNILEQIRERRVAMVASVTRARAKSATKVDLPEKLKDQLDTAMEKFEKKLASINLEMAKLDALKDKISLLMMKLNL